MTETAFERSLAGVTASAGATDFLSLPGSEIVDDVFEADILGSSLSAATDVAVAYLGNTCSTDNGTRTLTGTISSSDQVTLTFDGGGSSTVTINGTLNTSATPPFSGSVTVSAPGCKSNGQTGSVTGVLASSLTGNYRERVLAIAPKQLP